MGTTDPREPDRDFAEPDGLAYDPGTPRWNTLGSGDASQPVVPDEVRADQAGDAAPANPGVQRAAFGVILGVVAIVVGVLAQLAGFDVVLWLAVAALAVAAVMIGQGYRQWRANAGR